MPIPNIGTKLALIGVLSLGIEDGPEERLGAEVPAGEVQEAERRH